MAGVMAGHTPSVSYYSGMGLSQVYQFNKAIDNVRREFDIKILDILD